MGEFQGREPCPARILDDIGGAFAMGAVGGGIWHSVKGFRNAPRNNGMTFAVDAMKARAPVTGGSFATWGALFATFDCSFAAIRRKEDPWNSIASGAATGGLLSRVNYDATVVGAGGLAQIHTVMLAAGKQSMDIHSSITHAAPDSLSRQQQRNVVSDKGEAVFRGRIRVDQAAQGTDSEQLCRSLLLADTARVRE